VGRRLKIRQLSELFHQAESAYQQYELKIRCGDRDIRWPEWYAEYLIGHGLDLLIEDRLGSDLLAGFLLLSKADHKACKSNLSWEEFAAARMVDGMV
jgi:hypothetical protein